LFTRLGAHPYALLTAKRNQLLNPPGCFPGHNDLLKAAFARLQRLFDRMHTVKNFHPLQCRRCQSASLHPGFHIGRNLLNMRHFAMPHFVMVIEVHQEELV
jgi:hypothetical protein